MNNKTLVKLTILSVFLIGLGLFLRESQGPGQIADAQQQAKAWRPAREQTRRDRNAGDIQTEALDFDAGPKRCRW